jgi:hypothetical protein
MKEFSGLLKFFWEFFPLKKVSEEAELWLKKQRCVFIVMLMMMI